MPSSNPVGRFLASPLGAILMCGLVSGTAWYAFMPSDAERPARPVAPPSRKATPARPRPAPVPVAAKEPPAPVAAARPLRPSDPTDEDDDFRMDGGRPATFVEPEEPEPPAPVDVAEAEADDGSMPEPDGEAIHPRDPRAESLAEYRTRAAGVADDVAARAELAGWCDARGLWGPSKAQWEAVLRLDPEHLAARRRLGYRKVGGAWSVDPALAEQVAQKKADTYWKVLDLLHSRMHADGLDSDRIRRQALERIEAVGDPRAAATIWREFAGEVRHHDLAVRLLGKLRTPDTSKALAALAVYSGDAKARIAAVDALRGRPVVEYAGALVSLMNPPVRFETRPVRLPGGGQGRMLFVENEQANYQMLFQKFETPSSQALCRPLDSRYLDPRQVELARAFNNEQSRAAQRGLDAQVAMAENHLRGCNAAIEGMNRQVAGILVDASGERVSPDAEEARRWLAGKLGKTYVSAANRPKPTFAQLVAPLYMPTFVPVPAPT